VLCLPDRGESTQIEEQYAVARGVRSGPLGTRHGRWKKLRLRSGSRTLHAPVACELLLLLPPRARAGGPIDECMLPPVPVAAICFCMHAASRVQPSRLSSSIRPAEPCMRERRPLKRKKGPANRAYGTGAYVGCLPAERACI
jgi:hypothetical protein